MLLSNGGYINDALMVIENAHQVGKIRVESDY